MIELKDILSSLCYYDERNTESSADDEERANKKAICSCDNCFYGRSSLAEELLRLYTPTEVYHLEKPIVFRDTMPDIVNATKLCLGQQRELTYQIKTASMSTMGPIIIEPLKPNEKVSNINKLEKSRAKARKKRK